MTMISWSCNFELCRGCREGYSRAHITVDISSEIYLLYGLDKQVMSGRNLIMTVWLNFEFDLCIWIEISRVGSDRYTVYLG